MSNNPGITPAELAEWRQTPVPMALMPMVLRLLDAAEASGRLQKDLAALMDRWRQRVTRAAVGCGKGTPDHARYAAAAAVYQDMAAELQDLLPLGRS